jgi:hypothetical protein
MAKFKFGMVLGFVAGWAVGSGRAAELVQRLRSSAGTEIPGSVASRVPRPVFDRSSESTAVSA